jgi:hypothetical protein
MKPPAVRCRHCPAGLELRGGYWCGTRDGIAVCIKASSSLAARQEDYLLHEPMPAPLEGSVRS